jgi:hypothetical protein
MIAVVSRTKHGPWYLVDTCAGGTWSPLVEDATLWGCAADALAELDAAEVDVKRYELEFVDAANLARQCQTGKRARDKP